MKKFVKFVLIALIPLFACCGEKEKGISVEKIIVEPSFTTIKVGEEVQLNVKTVPSVAMSELTYKSTNPDVATVNGEGWVKGLSVGVTYINISWQGLRSARCTLSVKEKVSSLLDPTEAIKAPLSKDILLTSTTLYATGNIMQDGDRISDTGPFFFTQNRQSTSLENNSKYIVYLTKHDKVNEKYSSYMCLKWFGHGNMMLCENTEDGEYIWLSSHGQATYGTYADYGSNHTFSRFKYVANSTAEHCAGDTFWMDSYVNNAGEKVSITALEVNVDFENRRVVVGGRSTGTRHFVMFDLDEMLALSSENINITRSWGGEEGTPKRVSQTETIRAKNLTKLKPLGSFTLKSNLSSTDKSLLYSYNSQGFAVWGDYIYWYEGNAVETTSGKYDDSVAYVAVLDYLGNIVCPRTKVAAASDFANQETLLDCADHYCEAEGLHIHDGYLYLGIGTHNSKGHRIANMLKYKCIQKD
ncbi:MAG: Ig-like domain-containing protein [Bacteroidales bacterium]|nr:Ig-like domain-containing protein [Bacteroidales bacterium]